MKENLKFELDCIVCPNCVELLTRDDVEDFGKCPYCNFAFERDTELEDFLLQPLVDQWVKQTRTLEDGEFL